LWNVHNVYLNCSTGSSHRPSKTNIHLAYIFFLQRLYGRAVKNNDKNELLMFKCIHINIGICLLIGMYHDTRKINRDSNKIRLHSSNIIPNKWHLSQISFLRHPFISHTREVWYQWRNDKKICMERNFNLKQNIWWHDMRTCFSHRFINKI